MTMLQSGTSAYTLLHQRLVRVRGAAVLFDCVNCGSIANGWSHIHDTDQTDFNNYEPRCKSCHSKYDCRNPARGEQISRATLTEVEVLAIRRRYAAGESARDLACEFDTGLRNISYITSRKTWKHI